MSDATEKGDALERATRAIEEMVIRAQPGIAQAPFTIQPKARLKKGDQSFEIDLLVRINEGSPYETQHFFECKNWKDPVDRNVVTIFARKMTAFGAARGTIVGRRFTDEAVLEAKLTPNLELVTFTDDVWSAFGSIEASNFSHHFTRFQTSAHRAVGLPPSPQPDFLTAPCIFAGRSTTFTEVAHGLANRHLAESGELSKDVGHYTGTHAIRAELDVGELIVGDWEIQFLDLDFDFVIDVQAMRVVSIFSIEKRGRFMRLEAPPDVVTGTRIALEVVGPPEK